MKNKSMMVAVSMGLALVTVLGCAWPGKATRTIIDIVDTVCNVFAEYDGAPPNLDAEEICQPVDGLDGLSLVEYCLAHKKLSPAIRELVERKAAECVGFGAGLEGFSPERPTE